MLEKIISYIQARRSSPKYLSFLEGGTSFFVSSEIGPVRIQIKQIERESRPVGFRFSKHSIHAVAETSLGESVHGFGEDSNKLVATQKAISEAVERAVYRTIRNIIPSESSNGWACHPVLKKAIKAARSELMERDAALAHWHMQAPLYEISPHTLPTWLKTWEKTELSQNPRFNRLRVMIGNLGYEPLLSVFIVDSANCGFVSHGSGFALEKAMVQALTEVTRIASIGCCESDPFPVLDPPVGPMDHALYFRDTPFPEWLFGEEVSFQAAITKVTPLSPLNDLAFHEDVYRCGGLYVVRSQSLLIQDLYFGPPKAGMANRQINFKRLRSLGIQTVLNPFPHFVP